MSSEKNRKPESCLDCLWCVINNPHDIKCAYYPGGLKDITARADTGCSKFEHWNLDKWLRSMGTGGMGTI